MYLSFTRLFLTMPNSHSANLSKLKTNPKNRRRVCRTAVNCQFVINLAPILAGLTNLATSSVSLYL